MKVIVIGAGVIGVSTAYYLQRWGADVTLVERNEQAGLEASWGNGGVIHANIAPPWNEPGSFRVLLRSLTRKDAPMVFRAKALPSLAMWGLGFLKHSRESTYIENSRRNTRLGRHSLACFADLREESGIEFHHRQNGFLKIFREQQVMDGTAQVAQLLAGDGAQYQLLSQRETLDLEPALQAVGEKIVGGMFIPSDESGSPHDFCINLCTLIKARGATCLFGQGVTRVARKNNGFSVTLSDGATIQADKLVLAAGSLSPVLARQLGVRIPVKPAKGYSLSIPMAGWGDAPKIPLVDTDLLAGYNPIAGEFLRMGGGAEFSGYDDQVPTFCRQRLFRQLEGVFPEFAATLNYDELEVWAGFRPVSVDGVPIIGPTRVKDLYLNTGHGYMGWTMSAASGRLLADQLMGNTPELNPADYAPTRLKL